MLYWLRLDKTYTAVQAILLLLKHDSDAIIKIVVPTDLAGAASDLTFKTEMLGFGNNTPVDKAPASKPVEKKADPCCNDGEKSATTQHFATTHTDFDGQN